MKQEDILTWEIFLTKFPDEYESVDYDFHIGKLDEHIATAEESEIGGAQAVNQYKIDVVGYKNGRIDLIEVKNQAVPSAIGQLKMYKTLYDREIKPSMPTYPIIIARSQTPFMSETCKSEGILLILV